MDGAGGLLGGGGLWEEDWGDFGKRTGGTGRDWEGLGGTEGGGAGRGFNR